MSAAAGAMTRARLVDVPALAWVLGYAQTHELLGHRAGKIVAALAWPVWAVMLAAIVVARAGLWHRDRVAMAMVTAPTTHPRPPAVAVLVPLAAGALVGALGRVLPLFVACVVVSIGAVLLSALAPLPDRLRPGPAAPGAAIRVQLVASLPGAPRGALVDIARLVHGLRAGTDAPVEVCARDAVRARIYQRWGLQLVTPGYGRMRSAAATTEGASPRPQGR